MIEESNIDTEWYPDLLFLCGTQNPWNCLEIYIIKMFFNNYIVHFLSSSMAALMLRPQVNLHFESGYFPVPEGLI